MGVVLVLGIVNGKRVSGRMEKGKIICLVFELIWCRFILWFDMRIKICGFRLGID